MADSPLTFSVPLTLPDTAPVPEFAVLSGAPFTWSIRFDQVLRPGSIDLANIRIHSTDILYPVTSAFFDGRFLRGTATDQADPGGGNTVDYFANPPQLRNLKQTLVEPFSDFPLNFS
jgi:hypothetical protein